MDPLVKWLSTRYVMPEWWLAAWSSSHMADVDATQRVANSKLAPAMVTAELSSLAQILNRLQILALSSEWDEPWLLATSDHVKEAATSARSKRFIHEKVLQWLPAVRVLAEGQKSDGWETYSLCRETGWRQGNADLAPTIQLQPEEYGRELLFGVCEGYTDLWRLIDGKRPAEDFVGGFGPAFVWRSLWLELAAAEQNLLLKLEQGQQWHARWVQLEGALSLPLTELFAEERPSHSESTHHLKDQLQRLHRLGKVLRQHGYVAEVDPTKFMAVSGGEETGLNLVWQLGRERLTEGLDLVYAGVARMQRQGLLKHSVDDFSRLLMGPEAGARVRQVGRTVIQSLCNHVDHGDCGAAKDAADLPAPLVLGPGRVVCPEYLFLELCLRFQSSGDLAPPAELSATSLRLLTDCFDDDEHPRLKFDRFVSFCQDHPEIAAMFRDVPGATWAAPLTWQEPRYRAAIDGYRAGPLGPGSGLTAPIAESSDVVTPQTTADAGQPARMKLRQEPREQAPASGAFTSQLRRVATEELMRMRRSDRGAYRDLQKTWLASLSESERSVVLKLRQTLAEPMFDRHLKERLIKFMAEHPGSWRAREKPLSFKVESPAWQ